MRGVASLKTIDNGQRLTVSSGGRLPTCSTSQMRRLNQKSDEHLLLSFKPGRGRRGMIKRQSQRAVGAVTVYPGCLLRARE